VAEGKREEMAKGMKGWRKGAGSGQGGSRGAGSGQGGIRGEDVEEGERGRKRKGEEEGGIVLVK